MNNLMSMLQMLKGDPVSFIRRAGYNIPQSTDPNAIIQHLLDSGQVSQARYNQVRQMVSNFKR